MNEEEPITLRYDSNPPVSLIRATIPRKEIPTLRSRVSAIPSKWSITTIRVAAGTVIIMMTFKFDWETTVLLIGCIVSLILLAREN